MQWITVWDAILGYGGCILALDLVLMGGGREVYIERLVVILYVSVCQGLERQASHLCAPASWRSFCAAAKEVSHFCVK